jgi:hypothetical protein
MSFCACLLIITEHSPGFWLCWPTVSDVGKEIRFIDPGPVPALHRLPFPGPGSGADVASYRVFGAGDEHRPGRRRLGGLRPMSMTGRSPPIRGQTHSLAPPPVGWCARMRPPDLPPTEYQPDKAKAPLAEAGFRGGLNVIILGPNDRYGNDAKIMQAIGHRQRIGEKTTVEELP